MSEFDATDPDIEGELQEIRGALLNDTITVLSPAQPICRCQDRNLRSAQ